MGTLIVLGGMVAVVLWAYFFGPRTQNENPKNKGGKIMNPRFYEHGDVIDVGKKFTDIEQTSPYSVSERSLVEKRDKALEKASRKAKVTWKDRKELRKLTSKNLVTLTQETSEDLRDAMRAKFRSDLNVFIQAHNMRNMANMEKLKLVFEDALTEAYAESSKNRMHAKMRVLQTAVEKMGRKVDEVKKVGLVNGNGRYATMALESYDRLLQDTVKDIEAIKVRLNCPELQET